MSRAASTVPKSRQLVAVLSSAGLGEPAAQVDDALDLVGFGRGVERGVLVLVVVAHALEGMTAADAPWIEAHEVEPLADLRIDPEPPRREELDTRRARPARVHEQRSDPGIWIVRRQADQRELDRLAFRIVVVEGDLEGGALEVPERLAIRPVRVARGLRVRARRVRA